MKFTGQIRIPEIDHPGVPATFLIEGVQAEVILEGEESLGRWSLFDVQARRLVSAAFQVEFDGEEVTFIADEPIDFAYRGVEKMAEVWAKFKSMNIARRVVAVGRSRRGTVPSRIHELRAAMEQNLGIEPSRGLAGAGPAPPPVPEVAEVPVETRQPDEEAVPGRDEEPSIPYVSAAEKAEDSAEVALDSEEREVSAVSDEAERLAAERLAAERKAIEEERERLEEQRQALEELQREAERREADRLEAFRLEMKRLEEERVEYERLEKERQASLQEAMAKLEAERGEIEKKTADQEQREREDFARAAALSKKMAELEEEQARLQEEESERVAAAEREMRQLEEQRRRIEDLERIREEEAASALDELEETERSTPKHLAPSSDLDGTPAEGEAAPETDEQPTREKVPAATNGGGKVVDLGELETDESPDDGAGPPDDGAEPPDDGAEPPDEVAQPEPVGQPEPQPEHEPAMAGASRQIGLMGAVRAAFGRGGREHTHDFVEAPGGIGIARSICRDCGYVSITTDD